ncbi:MAG: hypothetical protein RR177_02310 [Oscillospiraceae bacterium]
MKKIIAAVLMAMMITLMFSAPVFSQSNEEPQIPEIIEQAAPEAPISARIENILNHNYCFGKDMESYQQLVLSAQLALFDYAIYDEELEMNIIHKDIINKFVGEFFGVTVPQEFVYEDMLPAREGFYTVPAMGRWAYSHKVVSFSVEGDIYNVISAMSMMSHDGAQYDALVSSKLQKNNESVFGFTLSECEILD